MSSEMKSLPKTDVCWSHVSRIGFLDKMAWVSPSDVLITLILFVSTFGGSR